MKAVDASRACASNWPSSRWSRSPPRTTSTLPSARRAPRSPSPATARSAGDLATPRLEHARAGGATRPAPRPRPPPLNAHGRARAVPNRRATRHTGPVPLRASPTPLRPHRNSRRPSRTPMNPALRDAATRTRAPPEPYGGRPAHAESRPTTRPGTAAPAPRHRARPRRSRAGRTRRALSAAGSPAPARKPARSAPARRALRRCPSRAST